MKVVIGAIIKTLEEAGADIVATLSAWAMPCGVVTKPTYLHIKSELMRRVQQHADTLDAVLRALHGSMTVDEIEDPEGDLLSSLRECLPAEKYLAATLDHHANVSDAMVTSSDFLVGYRTHPRVNQFEVGCMAAAYMVELIEEKSVFAKSFVKLPLMTPTENRSEPIHDLRAEVEKIDSDSKVITSSFFVGYPWADVSIQGASALTITRDDQPLADRCAKQLARKMWNLRNEFQFRIYSVEEAVRVANESTAGPFVFDELCDCTLGGASGDVVATVRYFLHHGIKDSVAVGVVDPESASAAAEAGPGNRVRLSLGGKVCRKDNPPLVFEGTVKSVTSDVLGDAKVFLGYETRIGLIAVVEKDGVEIVIIERAGSLGGSSFLENLGVNPRDKKFIIVKDGLNPLETYKDVAAKILMVDSPGFDRQILRPGDYQKVPRPIFPLDPQMSWN